MTTLAILSSANDENRDALDHAISIAKTLNTDLRVIIPLPDPARALLYVASEAGMGLGGYAVGQVEEAQRELVQQVRDLTDERCKEGDLAATRYHFEHIVGPPDIFASHAATLSDGVIFPRLSSSGDDPLSPAFFHCLMEARLPVLLPGSQPAGNGPVIIAWDGSPEVARSVMMHEALLNSGNGVLIAQDEEDVDTGRVGEAANPVRLESWLAHRGIKSARVAIKKPIGKALLTLAEDQHARLLVMGAYGHSRAGERIFGGASRTVFHAEYSPPLALAH